ncbi:MAG: hypothetical protein RBT76_09225 [candidate division Zixibacteria bacterium]|jgi:hypothetical protein|nr:hypothetical protein [candidate division Zixibacteria bacterium]
MYTYTRFAVAALMLVLVVLAGCDDRGRNVPVRADAFEWEVDPQDRVFSDSTTPVTFAIEPELLFQIRNYPAQLPMETYFPPEALTRPVPTLVLLAPEGGGDTYYLEHGLLQLVTEMTQAGEIQPMTIVMVGNDATFDGFFYGNSYAAGFYDRVLGDKMIEKLAFLFPSFMNDPSKIGIGGVGQGAYGAFRAAIQNPGIYGSISVTDGPLDFDGSTGTGGLIPYMAQVVANEGLTPANFRSAFNVGSADPITRMFIGGSLAFSPHDTLLYYTLNLTGDIGDLVTKTITSRFQLADTTTLIDALIEGDVDNMHFHLPFDGTGNPYAPIWDKWLANNLETLHDNASVAQPLSGVNIWIANSTEASLNYGAQTVSWIQTLRDKGYAPEVYPYKGYEGYPATNGKVVYDLMREILKFHSESFGE